MSDEKLIPFHDLVKLKQKLPSETYLGDGVYATGFYPDIILYLKSRHSCKIVLEPEVMNNLLKFHKGMLERPGQ